MCNEVESTRHNCNVASSAAISRAIEHACPCGSQTANQINGKRNKAAARGAQRAPGRDKRVERVEEVEEEEEEEGRREKGKRPSVSAHVRQRRRNDCN